MKRTVWFIRASVLLPIALVRKRGVWPAIYAWNRWYDTRVPEPYRFLLFFGPMTLVLLLPVVFAIFAGRNPLVSNLGTMLVLCLFGVPRVLYTILPRPAKRGEIPPSETRS